MAVFAADDGASLHTRKSNLAVPLRGRGVPAYLDMDQLIELVRTQNCDAIHPDYGFLAENADFARRCQAAGIVFIGPDPRALELFDNKAAARALPERSKVPLVAGINRVETLSEALALLAEHGVVILKALADGGRGIRAVF